MGGDAGQWMPDPLTDRELEILQHISDGMSDREIAQRLYLSLNTVKWHNRQIYSKLNVADRKQAAARASDLGLFDAEPETPPDAAVIPIHNLPAPITSFVGREQQIAEVQDLLASARLLTLCGPPGTGKTRLALRVAASVLDQFADGVFFVDLSPISDPQLVASTIGQVLGMREGGGKSIVEGLQNALRAKQLLLLLDNFEQIVEAAPLVTDLLSNAPGLKVMVTSREILRVYGEQVYPVPPLALPDLEHLGPLERLAQCEAVDLFVQRAQSARPDFALTSENARAVAETCARLDGLPLAIELAAARVHMLSPQDLTARLENRLATLMDGMRDLPPRHQTLTATIEWSYELLGEGEKQLLARLGAFQGGRTGEAAKVVCGPGLPIDVLEGLESLLTKSLLQHEEGPAGEPRFYMLETIHEFARHRLAESDEEETIRRRHAEYFLALAERAEPGLRGPDQKRWLERLAPEHDNMRTALSWSLDSQGDCILALRLVAALRWFWMRRSHYVEGLEWCERALEGAADAPPHIYARALDSAGMLITKVAGSPELLARRQELHAQVLAVALELGNKELIFWGYYHLGGLAMDQRDYDQARKYWGETLRVSEDLEGTSRISALNVLGELARAEGEDERAREYYEESLTLAREYGAPSSVAMVLGNLGQVARNMGDFEHAAELLHEALAVEQSAGSRMWIAIDLATLGGVSLAKGQLLRAARLFGATEATLDTLNAKLDSTDRLQYERDRDALQAQLDEASLEAALAEGRAMEIEEAVAYALQDS